MKATTWTWIAFAYATANIAAIGLYFNKLIPIDWLIIVIILAIATFKDMQEGKKA